MATAGGRVPRTHAAYPRLTAPHATAHAAPTADVVRQSTDALDSRQAARGTRSTRQRHSPTQLLVRLGTPGAALIVTIIWALTSLRSVTPLDALPFAWMWLTLWIAFSLAVEGWRRARELLARYLGGG